MIEINETGIYEISWEYNGSKNSEEIRLPGPGVYRIEDCIIPWDEDFDQDDTNCKHNWRNYIGFVEAFQYCTKCNEKRDIDE